MIGFTLLITEPVTCSFLDEFLLNILFCVVKSFRQSSHAILSSVAWVLIKQMSRDMKFPTMWYVRPAKPQISLRIRTV